MSGKTDRRIRKGFNALKKDRQSISDDIVRELFNSKFKYRLRFAIALLFHRRNI